MCMFVLDTLMAVRVRMRQAARDHTRMVVVVVPIIMTMAMIVCDGFMHMLMLVLFIDQ